MRVFKSSELLRVATCESAVASVQQSFCHCSKSWLLLDGPFFAVPALLCDARV